MSNLCTGCRQPLNPGATFCGRCGRRVSENFGTEADNGGLAPINKPRSGNHYTNLVKEVSWSPIAIMSNYINLGFDGRCSVKELWITYFYIFIILFPLGCGVAYADILHGTKGLYGQIFQLCLGLLLLLPNLRLVSRRLHDLNMSGWLQLLLYIPCIGVLFAIYIFFFPGSDYDNDYGEPSPY